MILCIDTATVHSGVALINGDTSFTSIEAKNASEQIVSKIDELLKTAKIDLDQLEGVVAIKGPGSFTGLRVGISVANVFAHELKIPIVGASTEQFYFHFSRQKDFVFLQSMNRDEVYVAGFGKFNFPAQIMSINDLANQIPDSFDWVGTLKEAHREILNQANELTDLNSVHQTWTLLVNTLKFEPHKPYQLVEPFYGKAPNISKAKKLV